MAPQDFRRGIILTLAIQHSFHQSPKGLLNLETSGGKTTSVVLPPLLCLFNLQRLHVSSLATQVSMILTPNFSSLNFPYPSLKVQDNSKFITKCQDSGTLTPLTKSSLFLPRAINRLVQWVWWSTKAIRFARKELEDRPVNGY